MTIVLALASIALQICGIFFLFAAGLGLMRFKDPLQRMHAATKAGTIGAGLILAGAVLTLDTVEGVVIGCLTLLFLLLTAPVASHLLGRAAYVWGTPLVGLGTRDALQGVLQRHGAPGLQGQATQNTTAHPDIQPARARAINDIEGVRFAIMVPDEAVVAQRALDISIRNNVTVEARAVIDRDMLAHAPSVGRARDVVKRRLADALGRVEERFSQAGVNLSLFFSEGNALALIPSPGTSSVLLILPQSGWCDHGTIGAPDPQRNSEQLVELACAHGGPCLLVKRPCTAATNAHILLVDDGTHAIVTALIWALQAGIWNTTRVTLHAANEARVATVQRALSAAGWTGQVRARAQAAPLTHLDQGGAFDALVGVVSGDGSMDGADASRWAVHLTSDAFGEVLLFPGRSWFL